MSFEREEFLHERCVQYQVTAVTALILIVNSRCNAGVNLIRAAQKAMCVYATWTQRDKHHRRARGSTSPWMFVCPKFTRVPLWWQTQTQSVLMGACRNLLCPGVSNKSTIASGVMFLCKLTWNIFASRTEINYLHRGWRSRFNFTCKQTLYYMHLIEIRIL